MKNMENGIKKLYKVYKIGKRGLYKSMYSTENIFSREIEREVKVKNGNIKGVKIC